jgi:hypothetical protein
MIYTGQAHNEAISLAHNRYYGDLLMRFLLFGWLVFQFYTYFLMADRPLELFAPINWFDKLFMPSLPSSWVWTSIWISAFALNGLLVVRGEAFWPRILLAALVMYINCIRWKYGFFSHVGHMIVLYHLLGALLPRKRFFVDDLEEYANAIKWLYVGLLGTYTFAGAWKVIGLVYKMFWHPEQINWLHPLGMKLNSIVGYRDWDMPLEVINNLYQVNWPWQIAFVLMLILQVFSVFGALRPQLTLYVAIGNILFHLINSFLIHIEFYLAPMVLLVTFFPYHWVIRPKDTYSYKLERTPKDYKRIYENGEVEQYTGFEAYRQYHYDKNPFIYGVLFFPGIKSLAKLF